MHTSIKVSSKLGQHVMARCGLAHEDVASENGKVTWSGKDFVDKTDSAFSASTEEIGSCGDLPDYLSVRRA